LVRRSGERERGCWRQVLQIVLASILTWISFNWSWEKLVWIYMQLRE
jgi:hypothetical protein